MILFVNLLLSPLLRHLVEAELTSQTTIFLQVRAVTHWHAFSCLHLRLLLRQRLQEVTWTVQGPEQLRALLWRGALLLFNHFLSFITLFLCLLQLNLLHHLIVLFILLLQLCFQQF